MRELELDTDNSPSANISGNCYDKRSALRLEDTDHPALQLKSEAKTALKVKYS